MKSFKQLLLEKTFNIDGDVDRLFNKFYKEPLKKMRRGEFTKEDKYNFNDNNYSVLTSDKSIFKSKDIIMADKLSPAKIRMMIGAGTGMFYLPINLKKRNALYVDISIDFNDRALDVYFMFNRDILFASKKIPPKQSVGFIAEFEDSKMKGSIQHEISHWLNDTLHNKHITKSLEKAVDYGEKYGEDKVLKYRIGKSGNINFTDLEIDAQIHNMKQIYRDTKDHVDDYEYFDQWLRNNGPSFNVMLNLPKSREKRIWMKKLYKRAYREGLVPKNMKFRYI